MTTEKFSKRDQIVMATTITRLLNSSGPHQCKEYTTLVTYMGIQYKVTVFDSGYVTVVNTTTNEEVEPAGIDSNTGSPTRGELSDLLDARLAVLVLEREDHYEVQ